MKGYTKDNVLYVFPQEVGQIPYVDSAVTAIMIQQEDLAAWKEANSDYASIMKAYNYNTMTVQKKVWADHLNDDIQSPLVSPELAWSADSATVQIGETNSFPTLSNPHSVTVRYSKNDTCISIDQETGEITLLSAGTVSVAAIFDGDDTYEAQEVRYTLTVLAAKVSPELVWSADSATVTIGADDNVYPTLSNPHSVTVTYAAGSPEVVSMDPSTGEVTLIGAGESDMYAICEGDSTYTRQMVGYHLIINAAQNDEQTE